MANSSLIQTFRAYGAWRAALGELTTAYRRWLSESDLGDAQADLQLGNLAQRLAEDRLVLAFVAGFPRAKSELINAILFADHGSRLLRSGADHSAVSALLSALCPVELLYDRAKPPCIELLPIETCATHTLTSELKRVPEEWVVIPLDPDSADAILGAYAHLRETKHAPADEVRRYGLIGPDADASAEMPSGYGTFEIPRWRHAVINFPYPVLEHGLVILDTPGQDAFGLQHELTLSVMPDADAVLLVIAADKGVTERDIAIWRAQQGLSATCKRFAVMAGTDGPAEQPAAQARVGADLAKQVAQCSRLLGLDASRFFPVSAQQGLLARIEDDDPLLATSGMPELERALVSELVPARHEILVSLARAEIDSITGATRSRLEARRRDVLDQLQELEYLRGKNRSMIAVMMGKVSSEKEDFERVLARYQALRGVLSTHTDRLYTHLGMDALSDDWRRAREEMRRSVFTPGVRSAMARFLRNVRDGLARSADQVAEISSLMAAMYRKFSDEHGLRLHAPAPFSMLKYLKEIDRLERTYERQFNTLVAMLTNEKVTLMQKFFDTLANQAKRCYEYANRETDQWLRSLIAPMETQVREHQMQLRRRLESVKRIHQATATLEERIGELLAVERAVRAQLEALEKISCDLEGAIESGGNPLARQAA